MTRKQFGAAFVTVLLIVAAGGVGVVPAADTGERAAVGTEAVAQQGDNATGNATDNATVGNRTDNVTGNASVTFENQTSNGTAVLVQRVRLNDGGFVEVTNANGFSIGNSTYLEPGTHENVTVRLDDPIATNQTLTAFALRDVNDNQQFDGVGTGNESEQPYTLANGSAVTDEAFVNVTGEIGVVEGAANETNATAGNATNATGNQSVAVNFDDDHDDNETADNETGNVTTNETANETGEVIVVETERATLAVPANQTGNGTTFNVTNASADTRYYVEARYNDTVYNTTTAFEANETFTGELVLRPELTNVTTVTFNVTVREAANGTVIAQADANFTLVTETAMAGNATAGNATNATNATVSAGIDGGY